MRSVDEIISELENVMTPDFIKSLSDEQLKEMLALVNNSIKEMGGEA